MSGKSEPPPKLTDLLLGPINLALDEEPASRRCKPLVFFFVSILIVFHVSALIQQTLRPYPLARGFTADMERWLHASAYMRAISSEQAWGLFSPNPSFDNIFVRVLVESRDGRVLDLDHDIYLKRRYPYLFYDRFAKINRTIFEHRRYREPYAAWVCRDWALTHGGKSPLRVHLVKASTKLPMPTNAISSMGFKPSMLPLRQQSPITYDCDSLENGKLSNALRQRYSLPKLP